MFKFGPNTSSGGGGELNEFCQNALSILDFISLPLLTVGINLHQINNCFLSSSFNAPLVGRGAGKETPLLTSSRIFYFDCGLLNLVRSFPLIVVL